MNVPWVRLALTVVPGLLALAGGLWVMTATYHPGRPHGDSSTVLLLILLVVSALAPPGLAAMPEGGVSVRRVTLLSGIAVAVALLAFAAGYYASHA
jgi:hypothetical protein